MPCIPHRLIATCAVLLVAGCQSRSLPHPVGTADVPIHAQEPRPRAKVSLQNEVRIHLPQLKVGTNTWVILLDDTRYLRPSDRIERQADDTWVAPFIATRIGRRLLRFAELPPGERQHVPVQTYEVFIEIE